MEDSRSIAALTRGDVRQLNPAEQDGLNVTISQQRDRTDSTAVVSGSNIGCAGARNAARGASLAWLWFLARLPFARRIEAEQARNRGPVYWYGGPGFYHGRWNGGGFGPCWTQTPIGNVWNCGR